MIAISVPFYLHKKEQGDTEIPREEDRVKMESETEPMLL